MPPLISVLTPTFNRAHTLPRVFASLAAQTFRDFEWVVVDDGSTDGTEALVRGWAEASSFPIVTVKQPNRGKHIATNRGVEAVSGELIAPLDSDDAIVPHALERLAFHWRSIPDERRAAFYAVVCHCADPEGHVVGDPFPADVLDARGLDARYRWHVGGEKWGVVRTDLMRAHPFPETFERSYLPESVVWDRLGQSYLARFVNEALRIYHLEPGAGSLGSSRDPARNARGSMLQHRIVIDEHLEYFTAAPATFFLSAAHYVRFARHAGVPAREQRRALAHRGARLLWWMSAPAGLCAWAFDRSRRWMSS